MFPNWGKAVCFYQIPLALYYFTKDLPGKGATMLTPVGHIKWQRSKR